MTAIAYKDGVLAADSVAWIAESRVKIPCRPKIRSLRDGRLFAAAGENGEIDAVFEWLDGRADKPALTPGETMHCILVRPDGSYETCWESLRFRRCQSPVYALGIASQFLMGALLAGASPEEAVRLAIEHTDGAGGDVQVMRLQDAA